MARPLFEVRTGTLDEEAASPSSTLNGHAGGCPMVYLLRLPADQLGVAG